MTIQLLDISHYQTIPDWKKVVDAGISGVYIKFSQGIDYRDPKRFEHYEGAKSVGLKVGPYHFVTKDNGIKQHTNFIASMKDLKFDLAPMLDCEVYTSINNNYFIGMKLDQYYSEEVEREYPVLKLHYGSINEAEAYKMGEILGYSYPSESIVDVMARRLMGWQGFAVPSIYTSPYSGNLIFKSPTMKKYLLHIAHWGVTKPTLPNVWKGEEWYMWQDGVYPGEQYGVVDNKVDHNFWGKKVEFPGDVTPPPPPPPTKTMYIVAYPKEGKFEGEIKRSEK